MTPISGQLSRYLFLEHTNAPDDPACRHVDLLLEDGESCRTWRLRSVPLPNGPSLKATPLPRHRLIWLERTSAAVSGGRGWGRRIVGGTFQGVLPDNPKALIRVELRGTAALRFPDPLILELADGECRLHSSADHRPTPSP